MVDHVLLAGPHPDPALAAAPLVAVGRDRRPLDVAGVGDGDRHVLVGDQVLDAELALVLDDPGAACVAELRLRRLQFVDDDLQEQRLAAEDGAQLFDQLDQLGELVEDLLPLQPGQALQLQVEDRLRLDLRQSEGGDQAGLGLRRGLRGADQGDHRVDVVEGDAQALEDVGARFGLAQLELDPAPHDLAAELDEVLDHLEQRQHPRPAGDDRQRDDAEGLLELGVLVEVVEDDLADLAALQLDHDPHAVAVGFVADVGDALDGLVADQVGDVQDQLRLVDLVGNLADDDLLAIALLHRFDFGAGAHLDPAAAGDIGLVDAAPADDQAAGREVGPGNQLDELAQLLLTRERRPVGRRHQGLLDHPDHAVDDLAQVVRRDVGGHADGDAGRAVDQQVRVDGAAGPSVRWWSRRSWGRSRRCPCRGRPSSLRRAASSRASV